jgi:hypothetical protein
MKEGQKREYKPLAFLVAEKGFKDVPITLISKPVIGSILKSVINESVREIDF